MNVMELADSYIQMDEHVKELDEELKVAKKEREELMQALAEEMIDNELQTLGKSGRTLYLTEFVSVTVPAGNKDALIYALEEQGYADLVKPSVSSQTLTALVKELSGEEDVTVPEWLEGIVNLYRTPKVNIRKSSK